MNELPGYVNQWADGLAGPEDSSADNLFTVDLAAMRSVETMLRVYLGPDEAANAANDVIARLRLGGFDIVRHKRALG